MCNTPRPRGAKLSLLKAGLPASGSIYLPRLPILADSGFIAAFVPGYGGGSATEFHRLPYQGPRATFSKRLIASRLEEVKYFVRLMETTAIPKDLAC
jgi:hypothetical protein